MLRRFSILGPLLLLTFACGSDADSSERSGFFAGLSDDSTPNNSSSQSNVTGSSAPAGADQGSAMSDFAADTPADQVLPPEVEVESSFRAPVVTGRLIWATNPQSGRVALVDAITHEVQTLAAGLQPTYLTAVGAELEVGDLTNRALVINEGSSDATLFRQAEDGTLTQVDLALHQGATAWSVSAAGRWAIAWSNEREFPQLDDTEGLQDITLIDLTAEVPVPLRFSVGYRPVQITIDEAETRVYAVTQDGISVLSLEGEPHLLEDITLVDPAAEFAGTAGSPVLQDVPITGDGRFAVVRFARANRIEVVSLLDNQRQAIELPGVASDVDLVGGSRTAVAVIRETGQVVTFDVEAIFNQSAAAQLESFGEAALGSVALPDTGDKALLFTNAVDSDLLTIVDLQGAAPRSVALKAPISAVFPSPEGSHAIALLKTEANSERRGAFSVVPISEALPAKIQGTEAPPFRVTIAETEVGLRSLLATRDDARGIYAVYLIRMPSLQVDRIELSSPPIAVGLLPEFGVGYIAQEHPEGRITFVNLETAEPETLTGFELAGRVVDGSGQL